MTAFGIFPNQPLPGSIPPPNGYAPGSIRIGDLHETVFMSLSIWSIDDYIANWKSAARCVERRCPALFCTDLTIENAVVFAAFPALDVCYFEQWVRPQRRLELEGVSLSLRRPGTMKPSTGVSSWRVDLAEIRRFALD